MDTVICNCGSVTKGAILEAAKNGATNATLVALETGASTFCGTCAEEVEAILKEA